MHKGNKIMGFPDMSSLTQARGALVPLKVFKSGPLPRKMKLKLSTQVRHINNQISFKTIQNPLGLIPVEAVFY